MVARLSETDVTAALQGLPEWRHDAEGKALRRDFKFRNFSEAFGFMTRVALLAEAADHHPDWSNAYNEVAIALSTHSAGGITGKDIALAAAIDGLLA